MTKREACEQIVAHGDCVGVGCVDCPLWDEWECTGMDKVRLAKLWLRLRPSEKKLVFSAKKCYADESILECLKDMWRDSGRLDRVDGKTAQECIELGFGVHPDWMEEI